MKILNYSEWKPTAQTLHMLLQMMGKVKLTKLPAQPEWGHVLLYPDMWGFTTGIIPNQEQTMEIRIDLRDAKVSARCLDGGTASFDLHNNASVADYFDEFHTMLKKIDADVDFNTKPQESVITTPFPEQTKKIYFNQEQALNYFKTAVFAFNALSEFAAPYRGKKVMPAMFWGTFDLTTVLFAGEEKPYPGKGIIESVAFDEKFVEFGYWPGDTETDEPYLFILPYPFTDTDYSGVTVRPTEAFFSPEKKEFFLPFSKVMRHSDPTQMIKNFCCDVFDILAGTEDWEQIEWFTKPLLI